MLEVMILLAALVGVVAFLMQVIFRWGAVQLTRQIEWRMRAAEAIVNHDRLPEAWLQRDRARLAAMRNSGKSQDEIARVGCRAAANSLRRVDGLIRFFESSPLVDSAESRDVLLASLRQKRAAWAAENWQGVLDCDDTKERR